MRRAAGRAIADISDDTDPDKRENATLPQAAIKTAGTAVSAVAGDSDAAGDLDSISYAADGASQDALAVGQSATDTFSYTVSDAQGATDTATVTVTVHGVNDGPTANDDVG